MDIIEKVTNLLKSKNLNINIKIWGEDREKKKNIKIWKAGEQTDAAIEKYKEKNEKEKKDGSDNSSVPS